MQKSFRTTLVLAVVLAGLAVWYNVYEKKVKIENTAKEEKTKQLLSIEEPQAREMTIVRMTNAPKDGAPAVVGFTPEFETIKLKKTGADWTMVSPVEDAADQGNVTSTLSTLISTKQERVVDENPKDLTSYGLKDPIARVQVLKDGAKTPDEVLIGSNTPVGFSSYAKTSASPQVFKVSRSLRTTFEKDASQYRNKQLVPWKREDIAEMEIQLPKENVVLKKDDKNNWILSRENLPADTNETNKSLSAVSDMRAQAITTDKATSLSEFGLSSPAVKLTLSKKDNTHFGLVIGKGTGKNKDKYFAKREDKPTVYEIAKTSAEPLERASAGYKNMNLAHFDRFEVKHIKLERGNSSLEMVKGDSGWAFPGEATTKIDTAQVDSFLTKLQDTKISKYLGVKDSPRLKDPKLVVRLFEKKDKDEKESLLLTFTSAQNKEVLVQRKGLDPLFAIKEEDFIKLNAPKASFLQQEKKVEVKKEPEKKS